MNRSFLILTTLPPSAFDDLSERTAILAARRNDALEARADAAASSDAGSAGPAPAAGPAGRRLFFGWVDRMGHAHFWPGLLGSRRVR